MHLSPFEENKEKKVSKMHDWYYLCLFPMLPGGENSGPGANGHGAPVRGMTKSHNICTFSLFSNGFTDHLTLSGHLQRTCENHYFLERKCDLRIQTFRS
jgi:hypothetical protein